MTRRATDNNYAGAACRPVVFLVWRTVPPRNKVCETVKMASRNQARWSGYNGVYVSHIGNDRTAYIFTVTGRSRGERCSPWFAARSATCVVPAADQFTSMAVSRTIANGEDLIAGAACAGVISRRSNSRERTCVRLGKRNWRRSRKNSLAESSAIASLNENY